MRRIALGWLVVMLVVLGLGSGGRAAPPPVTREVGYNAFCAYKTIEAAINAAYPGDTIKVEHAVFDEQALVVDKSLTIIGGYVAGASPTQTCLGSTGPGRATVHPGVGASGPLFRVQGASVRVEWFIFENGASEGVAVDSGGTLDLVDSIVQNNGDEGMSVVGATANLLDTEIMGNTLAGIAVDSGGTLDLVDSIVQNNDDGGLSVVGATANLLRTEVLDNDSDYGGGIYMESGASVTASDSLIKGNQGWVQGAGVYLRTGSVFNAINETGIEKNRTVMGCEDGGGIAAIGTGTEVIIDASQVVSNTALSRGGGLYLAGGAQAQLQNGAWVRENGTYGPVAGGGGGAHVTGGSALHVDGGWFYQNWSDPNGAGIYTDLGSTVQVANTWFYDNLGGDSGGGIYNNGGHVTCRNCIFYLNRVVDYHGGAISSIGTAGTLDVERTAFLQNTTDSGNGGAIFTDEPFTSVSRSYFTGNTAPGDGSALYLSGLHLPPLSTREAQIQNNYVVDNPGSSLYAEYITAYLRHNTFAHQTVGADLGVVADESATVELLNNIFANFSVAIDQLTPVTGGAVNASFTLFWNNVSNYVPGVVTSTDEVAGDPAFVGGTNYNLTASSAAINAGTDAGVTLDYFGGHRPWGGGFEIGAEEYPRQTHIFLPLVFR